MTENKARHGFTLIELVVVIAILAILAALALPTFNDLRETTRNHVDAANAAACTRAIQYYFADGEHLQALKKICDVPGSPHCIQMSVGQKNAAIHTMLAEALADAGLIKAVGTSATRYTELTCQSQKNWDGYYIAVAVGPDGVLVGYSGHTVDSGSLHAAHSWGYYYTNNNDTTGFTALMKR